MPVLSVYSTSGKPTRDIVVPGRSPLRPFGAVRISGNVGQRQESDWAAIKAALAAGDVVIGLSAYETDVLPEQLSGKLPFGGNVRFDMPREPRWRLVEDGPFCSIESQKYPCQVDGCTDGADTPLALGRHIRNEHRDAWAQLQAAKGSAS